ncbi:TPA: hypothetical protein ACGX4N_004060 [Bacillus cereus]
MNLKYMIGVDIGTTSTKLVLFSIDGFVIARHSILSIPFEIMSNNPSFP